MQQADYSHYTFEQLMKLKRNNLRELSKQLAIPYTGKTLKQDLANNILKHFNNTTTPTTTLRDYIIRDSVREKVNNTYTLTEFKLDHFLKFYTKTLNNQQFTYENDDEEDTTKYNDFVDLFIEDVITKEYPYIKYILNRLKYPYKFRIFINATFTRPHNQLDDFDLH